jgi:N-acyl amino acid synthase FeeM
LSLVLEARGGPLGRKSGLLDRVAYRLAETKEERDEIYRLRYRAYLNEGAIEPNREHKVSDRFDDLPNSWIFGVYFDGTLSSSLRISIASPEWRETPSTCVFPEILGPELARGKVMVDPTRFIADPVLAKCIPELPYVTLRLAYVACEHFHADLGLATVRAEHQAFYRRVFLHQLLLAPREYPGLVKPICLMAVDFPAMRGKVASRYPFFRSTELERRRLFERGSHPRAPVITLPDFPFARASIVSRP